MPRRLLPQVPDVLLQRRRHLQHKASKLFTCPPCRSKTLAVNIVWARAMSQLTHDTLRAVRAERLLKSKRVRFLKKARTALKYLRQWSLSKLHTSFLWMAEVSSEVFELKNTEVNLDKLDNHLEYFSSALAREQKKIDDAANAGAVAAESGEVGTTGDGPGVAVAEN